MVRIFVEGKDDKNFISFVISYFFSAVNSPEIIHIGGYTNLPKQKVKFHETTDQGGINLVIFDADSENTTYGGFNKKMNYLIQQKAELKIEFETFLFPNNQDNGTLETLLLKLVNPEHQRVLNCFDEYQKCLERFNSDANPVYKMPDLKAKIYALIDAFSVSWAEDEKRKKHGSYDDQRIWNLNQEAVNPLKDFLLKHLEMA